MKLPFGFDINIFSLAKYMAVFSRFMGLENVFSRANSGISFGGIANDDGWNLIGGAFASGNGTMLPLIAELELSCYTRGSNLRCWVGSASSFGQSLSSPAGYWHIGSSREPLATHSPGHTITYSVAKSTLPCGDFSFQRSLLFSSCFLPKSLDLVNISNDTTGGHF